MDRVERTESWQLRLLGGAVAAAMSGIGAVVTGVTGIGLVIGLVGIPVGALMGLFYAPDFMAEREDQSLEVAVAGLATLLGTVAVALLFAVSQASGASPGEFLQFGFLATVGLGIPSLIFGFPMTRVVMRLAIAAGRRLAPHASVLWIPSAVVIAAVAAGTLKVVGFAMQVHGDLIVQAAHLGQP